MTVTECYFISGSPPCWTVMLALGAKGVAYEPRRLSNTKGEQKDETFLAVNPRGNVPVLVDSDVSVRETNAILAYLDLAYPDPPFFGTTPGQGAAIWQIVCETEARLRTPIGNVTRPIFRGKAGGMATELAEMIKPVHWELAALDQALGETEFLAGDGLSAADLAVYPALMQLDRGATRDGAEELGLGVLPWGETYPGIAAWMARIETLPGYDDAYPPHWR